MSVIRTSAFQIIAKFQQTVERAKTIVLTAHVMHEIFVSQSAALAAISRSIQAAQARSREGAEDALHAEVKQVQQLQRLEGGSTTEGG